MKDLEHGKKTAQVLLVRIPHILAHKERFALFRKYISVDRQMLTMNDSCIVPSTLVTVHRARIVEDGYQNLNSLPSQSLKGVIRIKFINEQGLDEAGIDQVWFILFTHFELLLRESIAFRMVFLKSFSRIQLSASLIHH